MILDVDIKEFDGGYIAQSRILPCCYSRDETIGDVIAKFRDEHKDLLNVKAANGEGITFEFHVKI